MKLLLATSNQDKRKELKTLLEGIEVEIIYPEELGDVPNIDEDGVDLEENAIKKSKIYALWSNLPSLADDTGLEVDVLNGKPGVRSARYAGEKATYEENVDKLLSNLVSYSGDNREAKFKSVLSIFFPKEDIYHIFYGVCKGKIITKRRGSNGFGYDPVFLPDGSFFTFAQMSMEEKNKFSHRGKAFMNFLNWIKNIDLNVYDY